MSWWGLWQLCLFLWKCLYVCHHILHLSSSSFNSTEETGSLWVCVGVCLWILCVLLCQSRYEIVNVYVRSCPGVCVCVWDIANAEKGWVFSDACRTGPVTVEQEGVISPGLRAEARQPAGPEHPDELTAGTAQACLRPPRERKHLQPAIYLSVWLTMGYTWYNVHPQLTAALFEFSGCLCVCVCMSRLLSISSLNFWVPLCSWTSKCQICQNKLIIFINKKYMDT